MFSNVSANILTIALLMIVDIFFGGIAIALYTIKISKIKKPFVHIQGIWMAWELNKTHLPFTVCHKFEE